MPNYLVDTNVWSEAVKKKPDPKVLRWLQDHESDLYVSSITLGEIQYGIDRLPAGKRQTEYRAWFKSFMEHLGGRTLTFNASVATVWGQLLAKWQSEGLSIPTIDSQLAATAKRHSLTVATRNQMDFKGSGIRTINPFDYAKPMDR